MIRLRKKLFTLAPIVAIAWFLMGEFPHIFLSVKWSEGRYSGFGSSANGDQIRAVLEIAERRLARLPAPERGPIHIVTAPKWVYAMFNPASRDAFAVTRGFGRTIWIRDADFEMDYSFSGRSAHNRRSLSGVITHETVHVTLNQRLGVIASLRIPTWLTEGYCDFIADETSYPFEAGIDALLAKNSPPSTSLRYFQYYAAVRYLIDIEGTSFDYLLTNSDAYQYAELAARFARLQRTSDITPKFPAYER